MDLSKRTIRMAVLAALALGAGCADDLGEPSLVAPVLAPVHASRGQPKRLEVYTQNLYLGGDTGPLFTLDFGDVESVADATDAFWASVKASNIPDRAQEVVDEIEARMPHVVALQEAFRFIETSASPLAYDLLEEIENEIAARDLPYGRKEWIQTTTALLPIAWVDGFGPTGSLSITDQNALFVRDDVALTDGGATKYAAYIPVPPPPASPLLLVERAYVHVELEFDGMTHHVVGTHLETQGYDTGNPSDPAYQIRQIHNAQAGELIEFANSLDGYVIVVGDLNSDAEGTPVDPSWTPTYGRFMAEGFTDAWEVAARSREDVGFTCCTAKDLMGPADLDERIDFVLMRGPESAPLPNGARRGWVQMDIVGTRPKDVTPGGLWPSDHAGLTATMETPIAAR